MRRTKLDEKLVKIKKSLEEYQEMINTPSKKLEFEVDKRKTEEENIKEAEKKLDQAEDVNAFLENILKKEDEVISLTNEFMEELENIHNESKKNYENQSVDFNKIIDQMIELVKSKYDKKISQEKKRI